MANIKKVFILVLSILSPTIRSMEQNESLIAEVRNSRELSRFAGCLVAFKPVYYIDDFYTYKLTPGTLFRYGLISPCLFQEDLMPYYDKGTKAQLEKAYHLLLFVSKDSFGNGTGTVIYQPSLPTRLLSQAAFQVRHATSQEQEVILNKVQSDEICLSVEKTCEQILALLGDQKNNAKTQRKRTP